MMTKKLNLQAMKKAELIDLLQEMKTKLIASNTQGKNMRDMADKNYKGVIALAIVVLKMANKAMAATHVKDTDKRNNMLTEIADYGYSQLRRHGMDKIAKESIEKEKEDRKNKAEEKAVVKSSVVE